jgi:hypothetical protein
MLHHGGFVETRRRKLGCLVAIPKNDGDRRHLDQGHTIGGESNAARRDKRAGWTRSAPARRSEKKMHAPVVQFIVRRISLGGEACLTSISVL